MTAQLTIQFETADELDTWLAIFQKYNLEDKISIKSKKIKKNKTETPSNETNTPRVWKSLGIGNLNGALDNIPNLRDYAYED